MIHLLKRIQSVLTKIIRYFRKKYWKYRIKSCGKDFTCCSGVIIHSARKLSVGDNVRIGEKSYLNARGGIYVGNNVQMGPRVFMWSSNHNYFAPKALPFDDVQIDKPIVIKDNVWLGANSNIIPGVTIGEGAVVAMCSVVTKDVPDCAVVGGNPAKILKYRDKEIYYKLKTKEITD